jgi:drug/metabolite transporter (DMT)-like permease
LLALVTGLIAVSTAALFIRLAQSASAPSLVVATGRLTVAALVLSIPVIRGPQYRVQIRRLTRREIGMIAAAGVMLGLHFAFWVSSLEYTSVTNSVVLVTTTPLWVALLSPFLLKERLTRWIMGGLGLAMLGGIIVALSGDAGDPPTRPDPLLGNGLALLGAWMVAGYFMIGRQLRRKLALVTYIWVVYGAAAVFMIGVVVVMGENVLNLPAEAYLWIVLIGLIPQLIGHSSFNYAIGFFAAVYVTLVTLAEPIASSALAIIFLREWPAVLSVIGSALILVGIAVASRDQFRKVRRTTKPSVAIDVTKL